MLISYQKSRLITLVVCFLIVTLGGLAIVLKDIVVKECENYNNSSINTVYAKLKKKPYRTINDVKTLINTINNTGANTTDKRVLNELDGTTVVDNVNGHEYIVLVHYNKLRNATYTLVPVANNKSASINKIWQKEHKK